MAKPTPFSRENLDPSVKNVASVAKLERRWLNESMILGSFLIWKPESVSIEISDIIVQSEVSREVKLFNLVKKIFVSNKDIHERAQFS